ncbi:hypothetical protein [Streptomyces sp. 4N124]
MAHGEFSSETVARIRDSHAGRTVTLDDDVLVIWPPHQANPAGDDGMA